MNPTRIDTEVCAAQVAQFDACEALRDAPNPPPVPGEASPPDGAFGGAAGCAASCDYRGRVLGCGGNPNDCTAVCRAIYSAHVQQGACSSQLIALEDCHYSREGLNRGCLVDDTKLDESLCAVQSAAADACRR